MGHYFRRGFSGHTEMVVSGSWTEDESRAVLAGHDHVVLNYALGYESGPLDPIAGLPIRDLMILDRRLEDVSPILTLGETLEGLSLEVGNRGPLDLRRLPKLRLLYADWSQMQDHLHTCEGLEDLCIGRYRELNFDPLPDSLARVTRLRFVLRMTRLVSLDGVDRLANVKWLDISYAPRLADITAIAGLRDAPLAWLAIDNCRKVTALEPLGALETLKYLSVSEGGDVQSVAPLRPLQSLEELHLHSSTRIADGDLTPLLELSSLKELRLASRRHYRPPVQEIEEALAARLG